MNPQTEPIAAEPMSADTMSADQLMLFAFCGILMVFVLFLALLLVRFWGARMQARRRASASLDLDRLKAQLDAGTLRPEEYAAIRRRLAGEKPKAGAPAAEGAGPRKSIDLPGSASEGPQEESKDGQG